MTGLAIAHLAFILLSLSESESLPSDDLAQQPLEQERDRFELEELSAKRRSVYTAAAPGIITTVAVDDILQDPILTLADWLDIVPGFYFSPAYGNNWPASLGITGSVKTMIDGISITSLKDYSFSAERELFLEEFKTVETTSGPAGVLWGQFSLLGVVNLITPFQKKEELSINSQLGAPSMQRASLRYSTKLHRGFLRLFAGAGSWQTPATRNRFQLTSIRPFSLTASSSDAQTVILPANHAAVASVQYDIGKLRFYLRAPVSEYHFGANSLGALPAENSSNFRRRSEVLGAVRYANVFLDQRLTTLARVSWRYTDDLEDLTILQPSDLVGGGGRSLLRLKLSQIDSLAEARYRSNWPNIVSDTIVGFESNVEAAHDSQYQSVDQDASDESTQILSSSVSALNNNTVSTASAYLMQDLRFGSRLTLTGGLRQNFGGGVYQDTRLYEGNGALRLFGQTYVKFTFTQGMRPPQVLDRNGIIPVQSQFLIPETSSAQQLELSTAIENIGIINRIDARLDLSRTTTRDNIIREPALVAPDIARPVNADGFSITSVQGLLQIRLKPWDARLLASYSYNQVRDVRVLSDDPLERLQAVQENPRCALSDCANVGPAQQIHLRISAKPSKSWYGRLGLRAQCGGLRSVPEFSVDDQIVGPYQDDRQPTEIPCLTSIDVSTRYDIVPNTLSLALSVDNVLDQRLPPMIGSDARLIQNEGYAVQERGRLAYLGLQWRL